MTRLRTLGWRALVAYGATAFIITSMLPTAALGVPMVRIIRPTDGAVVSAKTALDVAFKSDTQQPITRLEIYVDDALQIQWSLTTPKIEGWQSFTWDFSFASATTHRIAARAIDAAGIAGATAITVSVTRAQASGGAAPPAAGGAAPANSAGGPDTIPPVISIYYPAQGAHVSNKVDIKADATDNVGVSSVYFYIDGKLHTVIINAPPYVDKWDTTRAADGPHVLQAKALDAAENEGASSEVTVIVENHNMTSNGGSLLPGAPTLGVNPGGEAATAPQSGAPAYQAAPPTPGPAPYVIAPSDQGSSAPAATATPGPAQPAAQNVVPGAAPVAADAVPPTPVRPDGTPVARVDSQSFGQSSPAQAAPSFALSLAPADPVMGASSVFSGRAIAGLSGIRITCPGEPAPPSVSTVIAPAGPGTSAQAADIVPRYADASGALRISLPDAALPAPDVAGQGASGVRPEMAPSGATRATLPGSEAGSFAPQRTSIPGQSSIKPITDTAAAQLARAEAMSVQPMLVFRPRGVQVSALGSDASPRMSPPPGSNPLAVHPAVPPTPAQLSKAPVTVASRAVTASRPPTRLAMLPRTPDERMTLPAMQPLGSPLATTGTTTASLKAIRVLFDNRELAMRARPELLQGVPMTALREIFEQTDGVLYWYPVTKSVRAVNSKTDVRLKIGSKQATVNQQAKTLKIAPYLKCGRTMVPLQFIADTLDVTVKYDPKTGQIVITSNQF